MPNIIQKEYVTPSEMREYVIRAIQDATELILETEERLRSPMEDKVQSLMLERARREGVEEQKERSDAKLRNILIASQLIVAAITTLIVKFVK